MFYSCGLNRPHHRHGEFRNLWDPQPPPPPPLRNLRLTQALKHLETPKKSKNEPEAAKALSLPKFRNPRRLAGGADPRSLSGFGDLRCLAISDHARGARKEAERGFGAAELPNPERLVEFVALYMMMMAAMMLVIMSMMLVVFALKLLWAVLLRPVV